MARLKQKFSIFKGREAKLNYAIFQALALKEIMRAWGLNPEEILTREALTQPHTTIIDRNQLEQSQRKPTHKKYKFKLKR